MGKFDEIEDLYSDYEKNQLSDNGRYLINFFKKDLDKFMCGIKKLIKDIETDKSRRVKKKSMKKKNKYDEICYDYHVGEEYTKRNKILLRKLLRQKPKNKTKKIKNNKKLNIDKDVRSIK